ncbi:STAS domain-containing protein [Streptomyces longwoodensis]|uniref:STAS domain-containing protein n=1 Tax=Streptomyces longwoodensis TaxID=68231 RepID=UPI003792D9FC
MTETERTLTITQQSDPRGALVVRVDGELDHHTAPELRHALAETPFSADTAVIMDLSGLEYCDSTGLTVLITSYHLATAADTTLSIVGLNPDLTRVFKIAGIDLVIPLHATVDEVLDRTQA